MENLKNYFDFSGTVSGVTFLLRWVLATIIQFGGGYMVGMGLSQNYGLTMIGFIVSSVGLVLQFSTLRKRTRAIFPNDTNMVFFFSYILISILSQAIKGNDPAIDGFMGIGIFGMFMVSIFMNSRIPETEHKG